MFVSERRFILKTCGTTTLLLAIEPLLKLVKLECGLDSVWQCFIMLDFSFPQREQYVCI